MHQGKKREKEAGSPPYFPSLTLQHPSEVCFIFGGFENNQLEFFLLRLSPEMTLYAYHHFSKLSKSTSEHRSGGWLLIPFRQSEFFNSRLCGPSTPYAHTAGNGKTTTPLLKRLPLTRPRRSDTSQKVRQLFSKSMHYQRGGRFWCGVSNMSKR